MADDVYIIGTAMTKFGKYLEKGMKVLTGEALELVLKDCGLQRGDMEAAWFSNSGWGYHSFQHAVRGQVALSANGLEGLPIINVENACACGTTALHSAWAAVKAGIYDCVLAIGAEKMYCEDRAKTMMFFMSGADVEDLSAFMARFQEQERLRREKEAREKGLDAPGEQPGGHSAFMDLYSIGARMHMERYGTTQRQLACIAA
ncbi:thiolase family protein, partial [bacterium]|nr:thiolase family protein [bacterium]